MSKLTRNKTIWGEEPGSVEERLTTQVLVPRLNRNPRYQTELG